MLFTSCGGDAPTIRGNESTDVQTIQVQFDTYNQKISYSIGLDHGRGCYNAYTSANVTDAFNIREIQTGMIDYLIGNDLRISFFDKDSLLDLYLLDDGSYDESVVSKNDASYCVGLDEAFNLVSSLVGRKIDQEIDVEFLTIGVDEGLSNLDKPTMPYMDARREINKYYADINKKNGTQFLAENRLIQGVIETESGLQFEIVREGLGMKPNITDSVTIHYTGRFIDGRVFESTVPSNLPFKGSLMSVIPGWQEGVMLMKEGGQSRFFIPPHLAYGEAGKGVVEANSTLVFDIELIKVKRFQ